MGASTGSHPADQARSDLGAPRFDPAREREAVVAFLEAEASGARFGQHLATTDREKLYRMGQKDGLLLAALAIKNGHHEAALPD